MDPSPKTFMLQRRLLLPLAVAVTTLSACANEIRATATSDRGNEPDPESGTESGQVDANGRPLKFWIIPDDYHVPYAGTAADGRKYFLSEELFTPDRGYVALFLWTADGEFDEVQVRSADRSDALPPGQAAPAGADSLVEELLAPLGDRTQEPIQVAPFIERVDGVEFGWRVEEFDGDWTINIEPGDFIAYYEPWDGQDYDT